MKLSNHLILNLFTILMIIDYTYLSIQVKAENKQNLPDQISQNNSHKALNFTPRSKEDAPGETTAGGSYGDQCLSNKIPLTALVYGEKQVDNYGKIEDKYLLNFTAEESPNFWFYAVNNSSTETNQNNLKSNLTANFKILNEEKEVIYKKNYQLPENLGLINITLDANAPALEVNKKYYWSFSIICDSEDNSQNPYVFGTIQRVAITKNIANLNTEEKIKFYAENGLWNETITTIIKELYPVNSQQAISFLNELLNTAQLDDIAQIIEQALKTQK